MNIVYRVNFGEFQFHRKITEFTLFMNFISQMKNLRNSLYLKIGSWIPGPGTTTVLFWSILKYGTKTAPEIMAPETGRNGSTSYERSF